MMKRAILATATLAMLAYAPVAKAATIFDFTFTGTLATAPHDPTFVNGTGKVTIEGLTGIGTENATNSALIPMITDININMNDYQLSFADIVTASLTTKNGTFFDFSFTGQDSLHHVPFELDVGPMGLSANAADSIGYIGTFTVTQEIAGTVPEPATWAMLVLGFGGIGGMLRLARRRPTAGAATV